MSSNNDIGGKILSFIFLYAAPWLILAAGWLVK